MSGYFYTQQRRLTKYNVSRVGSLSSYPSMSRTSFRPDFLCSMRGLCRAETSGNVLSRHHKLATLG